MKILLSTLTLLLLSGCCSLVFAADDGFGPRFGSTAPYALQNDFQRAQNDVEGIGLDDLTDIAPAAGSDAHPDPTHPSNLFDEKSEDELYYSDELDALSGEDASEETAPIEEEESE